MALVCVRASARVSIKWGALSFQDQGSDLFVSSL
jgi:hypothetical protein